MHLWVLKNKSEARWQTTNQSNKCIWNHSQFVRAVLGLIHTVAILQEAHHLVRVHARVWRRPQRDKLPEDYAIWPSKNKIIQEIFMKMTINNLHLYFKNFLLAKLDMKTEKSTCMTDEPTIRGLSCTFTALPFTTDYLI